MMGIENRLRERLIYIFIILHVCYILFYFIYIFQNIYKIVAFKFFQHRGNLLLKFYAIYLLLCPFSLLRVNHEP